MTVSEPPLPALPHRPVRQRRRLAAPRTILALMLREMSTRYGQSAGGYLWAVLEPVGAIVILSFGFSLLLRSPALGSSFILFFATGYIPFGLYQSVSTAVARSISFSRPLLMYPAVTWMDALLARFVLNLLTGVMVAYLVLTGVMLATATGTVLEIGPILAAMALAALLGLGVGAMNCLLAGLFPVWEQIWSIGTRPLFLISGVIVLYEDMPQTAQAILWWNPLLHIIGEMRRGFYPMYAPQYVSLVYVLIVALAAMALGLLLLARHHRDILTQG